MVFIAFVTNTTEIIQRIDFIKFLALILVLNVILMTLGKYIYHLIRPIENSHIILITNVGNIRNHKIQNLLSDSERSVKQYKVTEIDELIDYAIEMKVEAVYIYIDPKNLNALEPIIKSLSIYAFELYWVLPETIFSESVSAFSVQPVRLNASPVNLDTNQYLLKRSLDVVGALLILFLLLPITIFVAMAIKISDNGPIFFTQSRIGQFGKEFKMIKFRSMVAGSDLSDKQVTDNDERVTLIGRIMRKSSFDEFPQLINVIKGEMTLVGPRPHILTDTDYYSEKILKFLTRHQVKPGLTGLAQISSRAKTNSISLMQEKLTKDLDYINNWSLYLDIKILLLTPISLWKNRNTTH
ncbi:sugar transferase [Gammaproteobacteria bacterium]|nr:sugar transferase [Gammaproteobacteria bacterium]|tara:strand:- start:886 stop:1947 length:1062 start_codon:yes stop_codon:yes gene_type:complete